MFTASAMDMVSLHFLANLKPKVPFIKIGSGDCNNLPLIEEAAKIGIPLVVSTGMQTFDTVKHAYDIISAHHKQFALLHCVSAYPTPPEEINLQILTLYQKHFPDIVVGYSGHELGTDVVPIAVALGAKIIERHITLNVTQKGTDHRCSLMPKQLEELVQKVRLVEIVMGVKNDKVIRECELPCWKKLGKSLVASKDLKKGAQLQIDDLCIKVSAPKGIDAMEIYKIVGKQLLSDVSEDEPIIAEFLI